MGWSSGSTIMSAIIAGIKPRIKSAKLRTEIYEAIIPALEDGDWDTQNECLGEDEAYDAALRAIHPDYFEPEN